MKKILFMTMAILAAMPVFAWTAREGRKEIRVNGDVTTHIVMPENIKLVDISTNNIIGNQCADNMVRIKPAPIDSIDRSVFHQNEFLGTVTLIGERHMAQYDIVYEHEARDANSIYNISYDQTQRYTNPDISMPEAEMSRFAWAVYGSKRRFNNIRSKAYGIKASIYNIYAIGNYFFIDFGLENKTNVEYDIEEVCVTLTDKKETKATNSQTIQITPVYTLNPVGKFKKNYRQVLVLDKLTFPDEKVINITVTEKQISGRTITLSMEYEDVLNADGFDLNKARQREVRYVAVRESKSTDANIVERSALEKENKTLKTQLQNANAEIKSLKMEVSDLNVSLQKMEVAYRGANETITEILAKDKSSRNK